MPKIGRRFWRWRSRCKRPPARWSKPPLLITPIQASKQRRTRRRTGSGRRSQTAVGEARLRPAPTPLGRGTQLRLDHAVSTLGPGRRTRAGDVGRGAVICLSMTPEVASGTRLASRTPAMLEQRRRSHDPQSRAQTATRPAARRLAYCRAFGLASAGYVMDCPTHPRPRESSC